MANPYVENDYQIGEILYSSWGYDQTNIDWYQVVGKTAKTIKIRPLNERVVETGFMCGETTPYPNSFKKDFMDKDEYTVQCRQWLRAPVGMGHALYRWDGKPKYCSWYA